MYIEPFDAWVPRPATDGGTERVGQHGGFGGVFVRARQSMRHSNAPRTDCGAPEWPVSGGIGSQTDCRPISPALHTSTAPCVCARAHVCVCTTNDGGSHLQTGTTSRQPPNECGTFALRPSDTPSLGYKSAMVVTLQHRSGIHNGTSCLNAAVLFRKAPSGATTDWVSGQARAFGPRRD